MPACMLRNGTPGHIAHVKACRTSLASFTVPCAKFSDHAIFEHQPRDKALARHLAPAFRFAHVEAVSHLAKLRVSHLLKARSRPIWIEFHLRFLSFSSAQLPCKRVCTSRFASTRLRMRRAFRRVSLRTRPPCDRASSWPVVPEIWCCLENRLVVAPAGKILLVAIAFVERHNERICA